MSLEDVADRPQLDEQFDEQPGTRLVRRCSGLVRGDEFLDLIGVELASPPWFGSVNGRQDRFGGVG